MKLREAVSSFENTSIVGKRLPNFDAPFSRAHLRHTFGRRTYHPLHFIRLPPKYFSPKKGLYVGGKPYSEVTAAFLPSSLGISHSFALLYSSRTPVSVCGTDPAILELRDFSWKHALINLPWRTRAFSLSLDSSFKRVPGFTSDTSLHHERKSNNAQIILDSVIPSHIAGVTEY